MAAKKVTGQKLGLGAFHKATGGADEFLPSAPRGGAGEPSLRGAADNWKTDRESFQSRRGGGGGGGGRGGGFGGGERSFSRRPPAGDDGEDAGGEDSGPTRSDSAAEWRSARPARGGAGGGGGGGGGGFSRRGGDDGGSRQPFVAGQPRGQYADESGPSGGAWRPRGGARGGAAAGGERSSSFGSGFAARRNYGGDDDGGAGAGGRSFGSGRGGYSRGGGFAGGAPGGPRRGRDEEDGGDAAPERERDFGAWRAGNAQAAPARRPVGGAGDRVGAGAGARGGRFGGAEERPAHLRLKDRLKPAPGAAAAAEDGEADATEETPKAAAKPAAKKPAAAAEEDDGEATGAEGEEEEPAPAPKAAAKPAPAAAGARANPFGAARARDEPALAPIKGRGKAAAPAEEEPADEAAGEGEDQESEPVPAKRPVAAAARKPAARQPEPEPEDDGEGEQDQGEGEGEGAGDEEEDDDDEDDDGKPKSVWAANISAQKKAAKVAAAKAEAAKKAAAAAAAAPRSVFRPRAMVQRELSTEEDITPAESARRKAAEEEAAASKRLTANASNARRAVSQLGARPAAAPAPAARASPSPAAKPAAKANPFGAARPVQTKDSDAAPLAPLKRGGRQAAAPAAREPEIRGRYLADDEPGAEGEDEDHGEGEGEGEEEAPRPSAAKVAKPAAGAGAKAAAAAAPSRVGGKTTKEIEGKKVVSAKDSKSALDLALRDETTVTEQQLVEGLERLSIRKGDADAVQRLADVIAKSVIDGKMSLADAVAAAQQHPAAGPASGLIAAVAQIIKKRKGETQLTALVAAAKESEVDVFQAVTADLKSNDAKAVDAFLTERDLLCLKPMDDATDDVVAAIAASKPAKAVLDIIQKKAGNVTVAYLAVPAVEQVAKLLGASAADAKEAKLSVLDTYAPVLERIIRADRAVEVQVLNVLMTVLAKGVIKAVWAKLKDTNAVTAEGFLQWQSERPDPKKKLSPEEKKVQAAKQTAIIATSGWLSDVAEELRKLNEPEPEDGDEGEGDEGEEDEYLQNSNY